MYFCLFESQLRYNIVLWGNSTAAGRAFKIQKAAVRCLAGVRDWRTSCRPLFKSFGILPLPSLYIMEILMLTYMRIGNYDLNEHSYLTRGRGQPTAGRCRLALTQNSPYFLGLRLYQHLPQAVRDVTNHRAFKRQIKGLLNRACPYSVQEFLEFNFGYQT